MPDQDGRFEAYVKYLYDRDIASAVSRNRTRRHPFGWYEEFEYPLERLSRADSVVRLIQIAADPYDTFRPQAMARTIRDTSAGLRSNSEILSDLGFAETIDSEYSVLAQGMRPEHLPSQEAEVLRRYGFPEVAMHLPGILYMVSEHAASSAGRSQEVPPTRELSNAAERLDQVATDHDRLVEIEEELAALRRDKDGSPRVVDRLTEEAESKKKPRRWWKGLGQIIAGAGISLGDAAVAVGLGTAGVAPAWGALISVTVGVGTAMVGIGELRGE